MPTLTITTDFVDRHLRFVAAMAEIVALDAGRDAQELAPDADAYNRVVAIARDALGQDQLAIPAHLPPIKTVWVLAIMNPRGLEVSAHVTRESVDAENARYCRDWWTKMFDAGEIAGLTDEEICRAYWGAQDNRGYEMHKLEECEL